MESCVPQGDEQSQGTRDVLPGAFHEDSSGDEGRSGQDGCTRLRRMARTRGAASWLRAGIRCQAETAAGVSLQVCSFQSICAVLALAVGLD